jgi:alkylated DNA repair protein alkB family protein 1
MVDSVLHRDLSNPLHTTNLSKEYKAPHPPSNKGDRPSFFTYPQNAPSQTFNSIDAQSSQKPLNIAQFLQKKLRWLTLGTQYDWSTRSYPVESPTPFPADISAMVSTLFKSAFVPESGVVLIYSPKDYMPVHRDVSEECNRKLASFSLGCDGLFIISRDSPDLVPSSDGSMGQEMVVIRVRSGDVVEMGGETRWAWHAMPKVMAGTCPDALEDWPVVNGEARPREYEIWRGYMKGKRINISCRQVWGD